MVGVSGQQVSAQVRVWLGLLWSVYPSNLRCTRHHRDLSQGYAALTKNPSGTGIIRHRKLHLAQQTRDQCPAQDWGNCTLIVQ